MRVVYIEDRADKEGRTWAESLAKSMEREFVVVSAADFDPAGGEGVPDADIIFYSTDAKSRSVQHWLDAARELRCPYVFLTPEMHYPADAVLTNVLAPVTMLEEEVHKAELLSHLARYTGTALTLLTANDYGSRARTNTGKIRSFLQARETDLGKEFTVSELTAKSDSMSLYKELYHENYRKLHPEASAQADLVVWTASRDYGLDDLIFGPAERKLILHSAVPVVLINPRGDLYSLCD